MRFLWLTLWAWICVATATARPNVILILTDDQGYGDLGVHGNEHIDTPNLDAFAHESLGMDRFYVNPLCSPTRASLMTGRYHLRTGILHTSRGAAKMFGDEITIAELFRDAGYRTGIFGKWHLGDNYPMRPQDQGFEDTLIHKSGGIGQTPDTDGDYFRPVLWKNGERVVQDGYCTDLFFQGALEFAQRESDQPFFMYIPLNVPHGPLDVAERYAAPFRDKGVNESTAKIYGMLKNLDENFGELTAALERRGLAKDTIVIFMSDNGPTRGRYNANLRGNKANVYEGGIRVPFYVRWPGRLEAGRRIGRMAAHIDVVPTLLEFAGIDPPSDRMIDGVSLAKFWTGEMPEERWPRSVYFTQHIKSIVQAPYQNATVIEERYKLISYPKTANDSHFTADTNAIPWELYDLEADPGETTNVAESNPEVVARLKAAYDQWFAEMRSERNFEPGVIHVGTDAENPTLLCRYQDGHRAFGTDPDPIGWPIRIAEEGAFSFFKTDRADFGPTLVVKWQGKEHRQRLPSSQGAATFELEAGEGMLDVWTEDLSGKVLSRAFDVRARRL